MEAGENQKIIIVTGPAGAGRMTAIRALEDFGIEAIDNLPLGLIERILSGLSTETTIAIGVDTRTRGFSVAALIKILDGIEDNPAYSASLLYLDCAPDILLQRFSETRRRHPASPDGSPKDGIEAEINLLSKLKNRADVLIDTSKLSPNQLRVELARWYGDEQNTGLSVSVQSFSYKRGAPRGVDMMIDCRFLRNPHWEEALRSLTGQYDGVGNYIQEDPVFSPFFEKLTGMMDLLLPAYQAEGKAYFTIAMGCTGGQHRSVFVAEKLASYLKDSEWQVQIRHKEMDRWPKVESAP